MILDNSAYCNVCGACQGPKKSNRTRANGEGTVFKRGNTYTARVRIAAPFKDEKTKGGFPTRSAALQYLPVLKDQLDKKHNATPVDKISFCDLYEKWSEKKYNGRLGKPIGKSTITAYKIAYKRCEPLYPYSDFRNVRYAEMQDVLDSLYSFDTQKDVKEMLNQMSKFALKYDWCERNYAQLLDVVDYKRPEKDAFTETEVAALWRVYLGVDDLGRGHEQLKHTFAGYILIMIHCGLRYGEISTIEKANINFNDRYMMGGIKTDFSKSTPIAISEEILPVVKEKFAAGKTKLLHMSEDNFYAQYYETCRRAGVRELSPHCCRHTYISRMTRSGIAPAIIMKGARHTTYKTTLGYTHMSIEDVQEAVNAVPRVNLFPNRKQS